MAVSKSPTYDISIIYNKLWKYCCICEICSRCHFISIILYYLINFNNKQNNILENSSEDIIQPDEFILKKGETANVEITIVMSPERLEMLIGQNCSSKVININKISLIYGDEASRMRLSRLVQHNSLSTFHILTQNL